jgi:hypothetical protein
MSNSLKGCSSYEHIPSILVRAPMVRYAVSVVVVASVPVGVWDVIRQHYLSRELDLLVDGVASRTPEARCILGWGGVETCCMGQWRSNGISNRTPPYPTTGAGKRLTNYLSDDNSRVQQTEISTANCKNWSISSPSKGYIVFEIKGNG